DERQDKVYRSVREKFNAVVDEVVELTENGRPVLVGTTSVEISELLSRMLNLRKIKHQVLNAKQHAREADVVAEAGKPGTVTIATNMAGRGTDIKLTSESKEAGGLAIIGTERHESRRVDRQLRGRAGRQGDPGSSQFFVSLEDNLMRLFGSDRIAKIMDRLGLEEGEVIQHSMITKSIERAQKKVEENNFGTRKRLLEYDDVMNSQREVIYTRRRHALHGNRLQLDIMNMMYDTVEDIVTNTQGVDDYDGFKLNMVSTFGVDYDISRDDFSKTNPVQLVEKVYDHVYEQYRAKNSRIAETAHPIFQNIEKDRGATVQEVVVPFTDGKRQIQVVSNLKANLESEGKELIESMEKIITLALIDQAWKEHLREMDDLKQSVQSAVWEQKDPLLIYKFEAFELFKGFLAKLNEDVVSFLAKSNIPVRSADEVKEARSRSQRRQKLQEQKAESGSVLSGGGQQQSQGRTGTPNRPPQEKVQPVKSQKVAGRNDRVNVQYTDGRVLKDVKFKNVEEDLRNNRCVIIEG
ncbi:MAG: preprotein translocase subunit SecA, partial [Cyclobacteriaceae bacterium]